MVLRYVRLMHAKTLRDLRQRGHVNRFLAARRGLSRPHVPVIDMCLQITLGEVGALAPWNNTAHVEGTALALLNALNRVCAVIQGEAEKTCTNTDFCCKQKTGYEKSEHCLFFTISAHPAYLNISAEELTPGTSFLPFSRATKHNHSRKHVYMGSGK